MKWHLIIFSDDEFLFRSEGAVKIQNARVGGVDDFLTRDLFVSQISSTTTCQRIKSVTWTKPFFLFFFSQQEQVGAYDYQLSADRSYVAFMSNYTKVIYT